MSIELVNAVTGHHRWADPARTIGATEGIDDTGCVVLFSNGDTFVCHNWTADVFNSLLRHPSARGRITS